MPAGRLTLVLCITDSVTMGEIWSSFSVGILGLKEVSRSPFSCLRQRENYFWGLTSPIPASVFGRVVVVEASG